jgi:hypothetical protein
MAQEPRVLLDIVITSNTVQHALSVRVRGTSDAQQTLPHVPANANAASLAYFIDAVEVEREDFRAFVELHALIGRVRLAPA